MTTLKDMLKPEAAAKLAGLKAEPICKCPPRTGSFHNLGETDLIVHSCGLPKRGAYEREGKWYDDAFAKGVRLAPHLMEHGVAVVADVRPEEPAKPARKRKLTKADAIEVDPRSEALIQTECVDCKASLLIEPQVPVAFEGMARVPICADCAKQRLAEAVSDQRNIEVAKREHNNVQTPVQKKENRMTEIDLSTLSDAELGAYIRRTMQAKAEAEVKPKVAKAKKAKKAADAKDREGIKAEQQARKGRILDGFMVGKSLEMPALDTSEVSSLDESPSAKERSPYNKARFRLLKEAPLDPETTTYRVLMNEHERLRKAAAEWDAAHAQESKPAKAKKKGKKAKKQAEIEVSSVAVLANLSADQQAKVDALLKLTDMPEAKAREIVLGL